MIRLLRHECVVQNRSGDVIIFLTSERALPNYIVSFLERIPFLQDVSQHLNSQALRYLAKTRSSLTRQDFICFCQLTLQCAIRDGLGCTSRKSIFLCECGWCTIENFSPFLYDTDFHLYLFHCLHWIHTTRSLFFQPFNFLPWYSVWGYKFFVRILSNAECTVARYQILHELYRFVMLTGCFKAGFLNNFFPQVLKLGDLTLLLTLILGL